LRDLCKDSRICCGNGGPYHLVSSGIWFVMSFLWFTFCSLHPFFSPHFLALILHFEAVLIHSFCDGVIYDMSWAFSLKEITQFLMRSQIGAKHEVGFLNRCFSFSFNFLLIGFKLGDDLLGIAHLLPCDDVVKIWWQLVFIWPQIGRFLVGGDFSGALFLLIRDSRIVRGYCSQLSRSQALFCAFSAAQCPYLWIVQPPSPDCLGLL
jgi:hypothetical protein